MVRTMTFETAVSNVTPVTMHLQLAFDSPGKAMFRTVLASITRGA